MKTSHRPIPIVAALVGALTILSTHAQTTTPDSVKTRVRDLKFEQGFSTEETTRKVFDEMDYQRGHGSCRTSKP
jgi:hypothetical protein